MEHNLKCNDVKKVTPRGEDFLENRRFSILAEKTFPELQHLGEQSGQIQTLKGHGIIKPSHYAFTKTSPPPRQKAWEDLLFANAGSPLVLRRFYFAWRFRGI